MEPGLCQNSHQEQGVTHSDGQIEKEKEEQTEKEEICWSRRDACKVEGGWGTL